MSIKHTNFFLIGLTAFTFIALLLIPSVGPLLHPDSSGYIEFAKYRTAFYPVFLDISGYFRLSIEQIILLQILLFSISLYYLLKAINQLIDNKLLLTVYVFLLLINIWFVSLHKYILTESIYISLNMVAMAALINFFNTKSEKSILIFSLMIGLSIGVRPSGIAMLVTFPVIIFAANNYFNEFKWSWVFALIFPIIVTQLAEESLYRGYHGDAKRESILPVIIFGKGAIIEGDFKFNGPYKDVLGRYSKEIDIEYGKVKPFIDKIPYFWLKSQSLPNYEIYAQFNVLRDRRDYFSKIARIDRNELLMEVGRQRILQGIPQWIEHSLYHYAASWALRVTSFPLFTKEYNDWIKVQTDIPFNDRIKYLPMKGKKSSIISMVAFPGLLISGLLSAVIGILFLIKLLASQKMPLLFMLSGILSLNVHIMLLFSSFVNVATPRYLTTQFSVLLLALLLFLFFLLDVVKKKYNQQ